MIDPTVLSVIDDLETFQETRDDSWNIPRAEGLILHNVVLAAGCRRLVEVGTSYGFSGLFLGSAAKTNGGRLDTFDINPDKHDHASGRFAAAGLADTIHLHTGDARELLAGIEPGVDFAFLDATKVQTDDYWNVLEPLLAACCTITVDNTSTHVEELSGFVGMLAGRNDFTVCQVDVGNGFAWAVRTG